MQQILTNRRKIFQTNNVRKTPKETLKGKPEKNTSSPRPGPALMLEMIKKEERVKKEEREGIRQQQKEDNNI